MSRSGVLTLAVVVIGGLGALWYFGFRDDGTRAAPAAPAPAVTPAPAGTPSPATGPGPGPALTPSAPADPAAAPVTKLESTKRSGSSAPPPSTDGFEVRDHRAPGAAGTGAGTGITAQKDTATGDPAPIQPGQLHPTVSRTLHADRRAAILACAQLIQPSDRGAKPRIGAKMMLAVNNGALRVVEVDPVLVDVTGADVDAAKQCVREALLGVEMPAADTPDSDTVAFSVSYAIR